MKVQFTAHGWDDYCYWQTSDAQVKRRIDDLISDIARDPFKGLGKPEPLRQNLSGYWSRRITGEHRLVYRISGARPNQTITIVQARFHY